MESLTLLRLLAVYVVLTGLERATGSGAVRAGVNALGLAMPLIMFAHLSSRGIRVQVPRGLLVGYGLLATALMLSVLVVGVYEVADLTKLLLAPLFAMLGFNASAFDRSDEEASRQLRLVAIVLLLPVLYALLRTSGAEEGEALGIFANRNNAALYLVVLGNVLLLMGASVGVVAIALSVGALLFSTLGIIIAMILALMLSLSFRRYVAAYVLAASLGALLVIGPIELPIGERLERLGEGVRAITELGLWTELAHLSYADLYVITGENTDLSLFFRLKHWEDLLLVWSSQGWAHLLFGLGIGSSPMHTEIGLVPHNDYVRHLVESGPVGLAGFVCINAWLLWSIGRTAVLMSTAAVAIYFFTENLVTNFAAMTLYYWFAGYWARHGTRRATAELGMERDPGLQATQAQGSVFTRR